jgi:hypothetical protein
MPRMRICFTSTTLLVSLFGTALTAFAQAPAPTPEPVTAPEPITTDAMIQNPEAPDAPKMHAAPVKPPRASDDMTGSIGFGVGIVAGSNELIKPDTGNLMMPYWKSDTMVIVPKLFLGFSKTKDLDATWSFAPQFSPTSSCSRAPRRG